jgi:hypothetical protein
MSYAGHEWGCSDRMLGFFAGEIRYKQRGDFVVIALHALPARVL